MSIHDKIETLQEKLVDELLDQLEDGTKRINPETGEVEKLSPSPQLLTAALNTVKAFLGEGGSRKPGDVAETLRKWRERKVADPAEATH